MSYDTYYRLTTDPPVVSFGDEKVDRGFIRVDALVAGGAEHCSWSNHEADMRALSRRYPHVLFTLSGAGEEGGDLWRKYFRDGRMQVVHARIEYPEFDPEKLS